ncbi:hypothetical protein HY483_01130 [Candidatus Woesearchaeota archaeon]|nr:hypothetical protein [Candidatus Woesearchaeota archaeon]
MEILLENAEQIPGSNSEEIARIVITRFGLSPRKKDGSAKIHTILLELYEKKKTSNREKKPEAGLMTVEEMALYAGVKRQTMYDYLHRFLDLDIIKKTSFVNQGKVIIGYELNGNTLEQAFRKAEQRIHNHIETSFKIIAELQNTIKKEKLSATMKSNDKTPEEYPKNESNTKEEY